MRFKLVLLFIVAIIALSFHATAANCGTNWLGNDVVGNDPDFNVAAREQGYTPPASASAASTSQTSSKSKVAPDERQISIPKSEPNMDMPDPMPKPISSSAQNVAWNDSSTQNQSSNETVIATSNSPASTSASASASSSASMTDVSGKWSVDLGESSGNYMDLVLIQSGKTIMGSGSLVEDGTKIPLTMSGTFDGDALDLDAKSIVTDYVDNKIKREYKMSLTAVNKMLLGSYEAYASKELMGAGNVTARRP
ncbi:MAG TPA: hypothetical protein VN455_07065 [Methanotrichaceae archaeon]|nr:hypothetical protein [Methanotrichaceae archaeon]